MAAQPSTVSIPVETETFLALYEFLKSHGSDRDPVDAVGDAINYWMDNADWKPDLVGAARPGPGYRWKSVVLPDGTQVRMRYHGQYHYAEIKADEFLYDGSPTSPSGFANAVTNTSRNAWRDLEIKRPSDRQWRLATELRAVT